MSPSHGLGKSCFTPFRPADFIVAYQPAGADLEDAPKTQDGAVPKRQKRIPEYFEADEMNAITRAAPNPKANLLMLEQWWTGLRVNEALDLEMRDLSLDTATSEQRQLFWPLLLPHRNILP